MEQLKNYIAPSTVVARKGQGAVIHDPLHIYRRWSYIHAHKSLQHFCLVNVKILHVHKVESPTDVIYYS
jgi:hypothetical protein